MLETLEMDLDLASKALDKLAFVYSPIDSSIVTCIASDGKLLEKLVSYASTSKMNIFISSNTSY
jgi:hypothetical protein